MKNLQKFNRIVKNSKKETLSHSFRADSSLAVKELFSSLEKPVFPRYILSFDMMELQGINS